jgi:chemotaxis protein MotB
MKRRQTQSEDDAGQSGIRVLTVSLFIILLAFFIVLNSIGVPDEKHKIEALGSLIGSFGILPGGLSPMKGEGKSISPPRAPMVSHEEALSGILATGQPTSGPISLSTSPEGKVVSIRDEVLFDKGSCKIKLSSYGFLKKLSEMINQDRYPVEVTGHTDNRPGDEKSFKSNWEISSLRAIEILKFFVVIGEVDPMRLTAYGCGEYRPVASNQTRQTRAQNRRIDIILDHRSEARLKEISRQDASRFFVFKRFLFRMFD